MDYQHVHGRRHCKRWTFSTRKPLQDLHRERSYFYRLHRHSNMRLSLRPRRILQRSPPLVSIGFVSRFHSGRSRCGATNRSWSAPAGSISSLLSNGLVNMACVSRSICIPCLDLRMVSRRFQTYHRGGTQPTRSHLGDESHFTDIAGIV